MPPPILRSQPSASYSQPPKWGRALQSMQDQLRGLDQPRFRAEALRDDLNPRRLQELETALSDRRHAGGVQQQILQAEKQRIEGLHRQMMEHAAQQFQQRLQGRLNIRIGTPQDTDPQAAFMAKLMAQMQRRYSGMDQSGPVTQSDY